MTPMLRVCPQCKKEIFTRTFKRKDGTVVTMRSVLADEQNPYWPGKTLEAHRCESTKVTK